MARGRGDITTHGQLGAGALRDPGVSISAGLAELATALLEPDHSEDFVKQIEADRERAARGERVSKEEYVRQRDNIVQAAFKGLDQYLARIQSDPGEIGRLLSKMGSLRNYSVNNTYWLMMQNPDISRVASAKAWEKQGRRIRKGEKGLFILRPVKFKVEKKDKKTGEVKEEWIMRRGPSGFKAVAGAFDISQTELVDPNKARQEAGEHQEVYNRLASFAQTQGVTVAVAGSAESKPEWDRSMAANASTGGWYSRKEMAIVLAPEHDIQTRIGTLAHELAHHVLGHAGAQDGLEREMKEVEAESVAHAITEYYGIEREFSPAYISAWGGSAAVSRFRESLNRIMGATKTILDGSE
jgi:hypothetical protein